jgi:hypothetical protein
MFTAESVISAAFANTMTFAEAGGWRAFGGRTENGIATCGIDTSHAQTGRHFLIQWYQGRAYLDVRMIKSSWMIPSETSIPVLITIDNSADWWANALGSGREVSWIIDLDRLAEFVGAFRQGLRMTVKFRSGNEPPWNFSLIGTNSIMLSFLLCYRAANPTQPFTEGQPTQPFGSPERGGPPTQPFSRPRQPGNPGQPPSSEYVPVAPGSPRI